MSKTITIVNQKGGVAKTTTALHIASGLAKVGKKVLAIDLDPQGNLSSYLGFEPDGKPTISEAIYQEVSGIESSAEFIRHNTTENIDYIPATKVLAGIISIIATDSNSQEIIRRLVSKQPLCSYDYIIIDCKPSLDLLVTNALAGSDEVLVPVQAELFAYDAVAEVMQTIGKLRSTVNPQLNIAGILVTMFKKQTILSNEVFQALKESYPNLVLDTKISYLTSETGRSTFEKRSLINDARSRVGQEYMSVVKALLEKEGMSNG